MKTPPLLATNRLEPRQGNSTVDPDFLGYTAASWIQLVEQEGPVYKTELKGADAYVICGHDADLSIWKTPEDWIYGPPSPGGDFFLEQMGALHVTQLDGEPHRRVRKLLLPAFGVTAVTRDIDGIAATVEEALGHWIDSDVDLHPAFSRLIARCLSGHQVKIQLSDEQIDQLVTFEEGFIPAVALSNKDREKWYGTPEFHGAKKMAFDLFKQIIDERIDGKRVDDSLDLIVHKALPEDMDRLSEDELTSAVYLLLIAGVGNIANVLCASLWALSRHRDWLEKLRGELTNFQPELLKDGMSSLPLMKAFIREVERCHLPAAVIPKMTATDVEFMGYQIPKGVDVLQLHGLAHFDASRYEDPMSFRPERWLAEKAPRANAFGGGSHLCLGMGVTRLYVPLILGLFLRSCDWEAAAPPELISQNPELDYAPSTTRFIAKMLRRK